MREYTGWGLTQLKVHLKRLEELEYVIVHRGRRGQTFVYELLFDVAVHDGQKFMAKLIDVAELRRNLSGVNGHQSDSGRGQVGVKSGPCRAEEMDVTPGPPAVEVSSLQK